MDMPVVSGVSGEHGNACVRYVYISHTSAPGIYVCL